MTADEKLRRLEKWLENLYSEAEKEMRGKWDEYLARQEKRAERLRRAISEAENETERNAAKTNYRVFMLSVTKGSQKYKRVVNDLARQYALAGTQAAKMISGECVMAYVDGYNLAAGKINRAAVERGIGISFDLIDQNTVAHLGEHRDDLLLPPKPPEKAAELDRTVWNERIINAQVTQGIVQGEGPDKIAQRLEKVTHMNTVASIRTARTMVIGSRNAGHLQNMHVAEDWGVKVLKQWNCHHDSRTRDSHWALDRMAIPTDETFPNGCDYPGDPGGPPEEVYNCRCGLTEKITGFSSNLPKGKENAVRVQVDGERVK